MDQECKKLLLSIDATNEEILRLENKKRILHESLNKEKAKVEKRFSHLIGKIATVQTGENWFVVCKCVAVKCNDDYETVRPLFEHYGKKVTGVLSYSFKH